MQEQEDTPLDVHLITAVMVRQSIKREKKVKAEPSREETWISLLHQVFVRNGLQHTASAFLDDCKAVSFYVFLAQTTDEFGARLLQCSHQLYVC